MNINLYVNHLCISQRKNHLFVSPKYIILLITVFDGGGAFRKFSFCCKSDFVAGGIIQFN
nr:MAG TPA: hypothetical protein [Caudoviricetes sp.]